MAETLTIPPLPQAPEALEDAYRPIFLPSAELRAWTAAALLAKESPLYNRDHDHLQMADVRFLWTNAENRRRQRRVIGQAQLGQPGGSDHWAKARAEWLMHHFFGEVPDFVITLDARWWQSTGTAERCALVEHELYHCAQQTDRYGAPRFTRHGTPIWGIRGHDVEQFVGVVRRYGADAAGVRELVEVAGRGPTLPASRIEGICACGGQI